jgi:hypothetical protein
MKRNANTETQAINEIEEKQTGELFELNEMASNVLDFSTTLRELRKNVDPHLVRQRVGGRDRYGNTHMVEYVEWHTVADILDKHAPNWGHTIKDIRMIGDIVTVTVALTIDGVTREGVGTGKTVNETGIKKAEHDALKRAAVKFGIARELYKREDFEAFDDEDGPSPARQQAAPAPEPKRFEDAVAKSLGDLVTPKQLGMIRAISRDANIDAAQECTKLMNCSISELSKRAASDLIDHLQSLQRGGGVVPMRRAS